MKKKNLEKKLQIKKETITHLNGKEMKSLYAGTGPRTLSPAAVNCHDNFANGYNAAN